MNPAACLRPRCCASHVPATWDGWCRATARSTPANTASIPRSRALVAEIAAKFLASFDASRERCWIAEIDGAQVGSVFLVRHTDDVAKLRLLLVEPAGRGQGLGQRLVGECIAFAEGRGYRRITLWTQSMLVAARKIYQEAGFKLVATEPHHSFRPGSDRRNLGTGTVKPVRRDNSRRVTPEILDFHIKRAHQLRAECRIATCGARIAASLVRLKRLAL